MRIFHPTFLYIKRHKVTGKLYFGKTTKDPLKYNGSGLHWARHLKVHSGDIETLWYCLFTDQEECTKFALLFSEQEDIVNSDKWLNMVFENGVDGCPKGKVWSLDSRKKMSLSKTGIKLSDDHKKSISIACTGRKLSVEHIEKTRNVHLGRKRSAETREKIKEKRALQVIKRKTWTLKDPSGNIIETQGLKNFCIEHKLGLSKLVLTEHTKQPVNTGFSKGWMIVSIVRN